MLEIVVINKILRKLFNINSKRFVFRLLLYIYFLKKKISDLLLATMVILEKARKRQSSKEWIETENQ